MHTVDTSRFLATVEPIRAMEPHTILSAHLPPAVGRSTDLLDTIAQAPHSEPFVGPDQAALEQMLANFEPKAT